MLGRVLAFSGPGRCRSAPPCASASACAVLGVIEPPNYVFGHLRKVKECESHKGLPGGEQPGRHGGFIQRYIKGDVNIVVRRTRRANRDYGIVIEFGPRRGTAKTGGNGVAFNAYASSRYVHTNQPLMPADDVERAHQIHYTVKVRLRRSARTPSANTGGPLLPLPAPACATPRRTASWSFGLSQIERGAPAARIQPPLANILPEILLQSSSLSGVTWGALVCALRSCAKCRC